MPERKFGQLDGIPPGTYFADRHELMVSGVHRQPQAGIAWTRNGADSVILSGGYEDDEDHGDIVIYTGEGGNLNRKQIAHQSLTRGNFALAQTCTAGQPVRLVRGIKKRYGSGASIEGKYRYDGLYAVDGYWSRLGKSGFRVWQFKLVRIDADQVVGVPLAGILESAPGYDAGAADESAPRLESVVRRIVRNTEVAASVKELYAGRCQVCQTTIPTLAGNYSEAAHIQPLGMPHNGPDHPSNVLCLCPNHHVMFDLGGFVVSDDLELMSPRTGELLGRLHVLPNHNIDMDRIRYHRRMFQEDIVVPFEPGPRSYRARKSRGQDGQQQKLLS
jgi:putative restriction endonuclease